MLNYEFYNILIIIPIQYIITHGYCISAIQACPVPTRALTSLKQVVM